MTKRDKIVMLSSVLLAVCVIVSTVLFSVNSNKNNEGLNLESFIYIAAVLLTGIISITAVYFTKVRKSKYEKNLNSSYFMEYEIIKDGIINSQLSDKSKKETTEDILDILLEAQKAGKSIADVIGDPAKFSQKIVRAFSSPGRYMVLSIFDGIKAFVLFITGANIVLWLEQADKSFFNIGIDISMIFLFIITAFGLIPVIKKLTSTKNPWMFMIPLGFGLAFVAAAEVLRKYFYDIEFIKILLDGTITMIPNITVFMIYLLSIPVLMKMKSFIRKLPMRGLYD